MAKKRKTEKVAPAEPLKNGKPGSLADVSSKQQDKASPPASKRKKTVKNSATPPPPVDIDGQLRDWRLVRVEE